MKSFASLQSGTFVSSLLLVQAHKSDLEKAKHAKLFTDDEINFINVPHAEQEQNHRWQKNP